MSILLVLMTGCISAPQEAGTHASETASFPLERTEDMILQLGDHVEVWDTELILSVEDTHQHDLLADHELAFVRRLKDGSLLVRERSNQPTMDVLEALDRDPCNPQGNHGATWL